MPAPKQLWWSDLKAPDITTHIASVLLERHPAPEWATFDEFCGGTGSHWGADRYVDIVAMHLWASSHVGSKPHVVAYEIKATRQDFAKELSDVNKRSVSERIATECYFAMPVGLVKVDEIPEGWGLLEVLQNRKTRIKKRAQLRKLEAWPWGTTLSLARRLYRKEHGHEDANMHEKRGKLLTWRLAGQDLTEVEFREAVQTTFKDELARALRVEKDSVIRRWQADDQNWKRLNVLAQAVYTVTGLYNPTGERFLEWAKGNKTDKTLLRQIHNLRDACNKILAEEP